MKHYPAQPLPDGRTMLNVGCGNRYHPEWTNIDHISRKPEHVISHDITTGLPFDANTFDVVYHSHVLEHLQPADGKALLRECHRVLKHGGILRVLVPDLEYSARLYLQSLEAVSANPSDVHDEHYQWALLNLIDQMVRIKSGGEMVPFIKRETVHDLDFIIKNGGGNTIREIRQPQPATKKRTLPFHKKLLAWIRYRIFKRGSLSDDENFLRFRKTGEVHQWMYDRYSLAMTLSECGFINLTHLDVNESQIKDWSSFHLDIDANGQVHKPASLVYEGAK